MAKISRRAYAEMFGPTVGDRLRLADTALMVEVEHDFTIYGEEVKFGGGKVIRDGMGQGQGVSADVADTIITNALIVDAVAGIVKADVGLKDGRIWRIGKGGNPDIQPGVTIPIGAGTEVIAGEGMILTAGGIDSHIHWICPQQIEEALSSGVTTMLGGGTGPATGTFATTCTPGPWHIHRMLEAARGDDLAFACDHFGAGADDDVDAGLDVRVACFADARDTAAGDADIGFDDAPVVEDQRVGDHSVDGTLRTRGLRLTHAVADDLAAAEFHFLAVDREILLDLDDQLGIGKPHLVADGRAEHVGIGSAGNLLRHSARVPQGLISCSCVSWLEAMCQPWPSRT